MTTPTFGGAPDRESGLDRGSGPDPGGLPSASQIREAGFPTVRRGGYDPEQVHAYLDKLADWIERFRTELADTKSRLQRTREELQTAIAPEPKGNAYVELGHHVAGLLQVADEHAEKIRVEAQEIADQEIERAREGGRKLLEDMEAEATRVRQGSHVLLEQAQDRASAMLAEPEVLQREARAGAERQISEARARAADILRQSEAEAARIRDRNRMDHGSVYEEADALRAAGDELRATLESMRQRLARFPEGPVDSPTRSEAIPDASSEVPAAPARSEAIPDAPSEVPAAPQTRSEAIPDAPSEVPAAPARERRDDVSPDADQRRDELRQLFDESEKVDAHLEGLGEELFSDEEG
jgi:DivIVA domain-containing protein